MSTLAIAESLTVGHLQALAGSQSGASRFFLGGITAYTLEQKVSQLRVDPVLAKQYNCVHQDIAIQMAQGVIQLFGSEWGISTTGYAEVWEEGGVLVPYARYAVVNQRDGVFYIVESAMIEFSGSRIDVQRFVAQSVRDRISHHIVF